MMDLFDLPDGTAAGTTRPGGMGAAAERRSPSRPPEVGDLERAVAELEASGSYRVLRRLDPDASAYAVHSDVGKRHRVGLIVDTETTGLDVARDEVIEIGVLAFAYDEHSILGVVETFEALQQPKWPLSPAIVELTGLRDADLAGRTIDRSRLSELVRSADLIVAHNAKFDRPFCERLCSDFARKAWACSATEIPWRSFGMEGAKLGTLLAAAGYFHDGHRALADCAALLRILTSPAAEGRRSPFQHLLLSARAFRYEIRAEKAPFGAKDLLKSRGYRWDDGSGGRPKCWWTTVAEADLQSELEVLRLEVYRSSFLPPYRRIGAVDRFK